MKLRYVAKNRQKEQQQRAQDVVIHSTSVLMRTNYIHKVNYYTLCVTNVRILYACYCICSYFSLFNIHRV